MQLLFVSIPSYYCFAAVTKFTLSHNWLLNTAKENFLRQTFAAIKVLGTRAVHATQARTV
jgi:hypothetical protein